MLRRGVKLRSQHQNCDFISDTLSSDEMRLDSEEIKKPTTVLKKKNRKRNKSDKDKLIIEQSSSEEPVVAIKKKKPKKKKSKDASVSKEHVGDQHVGEERKIVRGTRRLQKQNNVEVSSPNVSLGFKSPSPVKKAIKPIARVSLSTRYNQNKLKGETLIDDKENESLNVSVDDGSNLKSNKKHKKVLANMPDENLIETSVEKYSKLERNTRKVNAFDEPLDITLDEVDSVFKVKSPEKVIITRGKNKNNSYETKLNRSLEQVLPEKLSVIDLNSTVNLNKTFETNTKNNETYDLSSDKSPLKSLDKSLEKVTRNKTDTPENKQNAKKRGTFEKSPQKSFDNEYTLSSETRTLRGSSIKRNTFEMAVDAEDAPQTNDFEPKLKKRNNNSYSPIVSPVKTTKINKRSTFEKKPQEALLQVIEDGGERRQTFDVNVSGVSPKTSLKVKKRDTYELETCDAGKLNVGDAKNLEVSLVLRNTRSSKRDIKKTPSTLVVKRKSFNTPSSMKKLSAAVQDGMKIKISDSKSSLSESGLSSASKLLRRANKLNPPSAKSSTAVLHVAKAKSPNKTTPSRSHSKVKKVPNYSAIHQKAYDCMESVDVFMQRKADRAKALLSGIKVPPTTRRTPKIEDKQAKKQLFNTTLPSADVQFKPSFKFTSKTTNSPVTFGLSRNTRQLGAGDASRIESPDARKKSVKKAVGFNVATPERRLRSAQHVKTPKPTKQEVWNAYGTKIPRPAPIPAPLFTTGVASSAALTSVSQPQKSNVLSKNPLRLKQVESISTKSKASSTTVDSRRNIIRGVRSNRRFDLLMSMRK